MLQPILAGLFLAATAAVTVVFLRWGARWGATDDECAADMPGDAYLEDGPPARVAMTRAVSLTRPPETVWPWLAQLGRGAGFYSFDRLDNGGRTSARHIVSWIPPARPGDATAIGYLRRRVEGSDLTWWAPGGRFLGAVTRLVVDIRLHPTGSGSRLVIRMSADAAGPTARVALWVFRTLDTVMARRQLLGIRDRVEAYGARTADPGHPETGARDQYQLYEVIYASGERAGVPGREQGLRWCERAAADGVLVTTRQHTEHKGPVR